ncbi:MAG TPA: Ig-like domain-containing protein [Gaiellales bacterium]|jgi:lipoprotein-anchoring transpeptidase ErfK/SrfK|nr:Ig-like domain-containing protein [Gaiellales bacterium]
MSSFRAPICAAILLCVAASGCDGASAASGSSPQSTAVSTPVVSAARITITPGGGRHRAHPERGVVVRATGGTLSDVTVTARGRQVPGRLSHHQTVWKAKGTLHTNTTYTVAATAVDANGTPKTRSVTFHTLKPRNVEQTTIFESRDATYGVGMPVMLSFSTPVVYKRAVERALTLRSSKPVVGAWYWDGDSSVQFRPRGYWPQNTVVRFQGNLDGVEVAPGVYGTHTLTQRFRIGRSVIVVASTASHDLHLYVAKKLFATWPVSTGKPGDDTPNGTYLTIEKGNPVEMKGPGYDLMVPWSVRFTWSGDYLHDAYWSVGQQGFENVSHGCVNLSPANAETYYNMAVPGNPVTITGSPRSGAWGNGWTIWFLSWHDLVRGSALHRAVRVNAHGSTFIKPSEIRRHAGTPPLHGPEPGNFNAG